MKTVRQQALLLTSLFAGACFVMLLYVADPTTTRWYPPCPFHKLTGLDCPGCGSSRGLHSLLHGHFLAAMDYNLLLIPALLLLASAFLFKLTGHGGRLWTWCGKPRIILWIVCLFWIVRNIPMSPFSWLNSGIPLK